MTPPEIPTSTGCWSDYAAELRPSDAARRALLVAGWLTLLAGAAILAHLPAAPGLRALAVILWTADALRQLRRQADAHRRLRRLVVDPDGLTVVGRDGRRTAVVVMRGSRLAGRAAWLRYRPPAGPCCGELFLAAAQRRRDWRRFRVLWRHRG